MMYDIFVQYEIISQILLSCHSNKRLRRIETERERWGEMKREMKRERKTEMYVYISRIKS